MAICILHDNQATADSLNDNEKVIFGVLICHTKSLQLVYIRYLTDELRLTNSAHTQVNG